RAANRLTGIHVPDEQQELSRLLNRTRGSLVKERTRIGNKIKSKLYQFGLIPRDDESIMNNKQVTYWMNKDDLANELKIILNSFGRLWISINQEVKILDKKLKEQAKEQPILEKIYRSAPGIGPVAARELANELSDMKQFKNEKALFSFTG